MPGPGSSTAAAAASSRSHPPLQPLPATLPAAMGRSGRLHDPPPSAPPGFRGTQGRVRVAAQRLPDRRRGRVLSSGKVRGGGNKGRTAQHPPGQLSAPGPVGAAPTRTRTAQSSARPRSSLRSQPPRCSGCMQTLNLHSPQTHGHTRTPRGRWARPRHPKVHAHVCTRSHTHTQTAGPQRSARRPDTLHTRRSLLLPPASLRRRLGA